MRRLHRLFVVGFFVSLFVYCSGGSKNPGNPDAGGTGSTGTSTSGSSGTGSSGSSGGCASDTECTPSTFCIQGHCGLCNGTRPLPCEAGDRCLSSGKCSPRDAGGTDTTSSSSGSDTGSTGSDTGSSGSDTGSTGSDTGSTGSSGSSGSISITCVHRSDCPGAQACVPEADGGKVCGDPSAAGSCSNNDVCAKGFICQSQTCVAGCFNNADCHGSGLPRCVPGNPGHCAACTSSTQCNAGEVCQSGDCVQPTSCQTGNDCQNLGCVNAICAPCTENTQCATGLDCDTATGTCAPPTGCQSDTECRALNDGNLAWWCNPAAQPLPACELGCVPDDQCATPQRGCCNVAGGLTCDTTAHACEVVDAGPGTTTGSGSTSGGSSGSTGTTAGACESCTVNADCASRQCLGDVDSPTGRSCGDACTSGNHCGDALDACYTIPDGGSGAKACFPLSGSCFSEGYYCRGCTKDADCPSGLCIGDASATDGGSCAIRCDANGNCGQAGASCATVYDVSDPFHTAPKHACFPTSGACN